MLTPLELLVLATVAYTDQFSYPLSAAEIGQRLVSPTALKSIGVASRALPLTAGQKVSAVELRAALSSLERQGRVVHQGQWYALPFKSVARRRNRQGAEAKNPFALRRERALISRARQADWVELRAALAKLPWIEAVAITGSAAMANASAQADTDVLVVAAPRRLWLARLATLAIAVARRRRTATGWCFNLWLEPATLSLAPARQGVYEAYELWQCRWLVDKHQSHQNWLKGNKWFQQFLPHAPVKSVLLSLSKASSQAESGTFSTQSWLGDGLNYLAYQLQVRYRAWRYGEALPPLDQAFLHKSGARRQIYQRWQASLARSLVH